MSPRLSRFARRLALCLLLPWAPVAQAQTAPAPFGVAGSLDPAFSAGDLPLDVPVSQLFPLADGGVLASGPVVISRDAAGNPTYANRTVRFRADGSLDTTFQAQAQAAVGLDLATRAVQPDGKTLAVNPLGGGGQQLVRLNADGSRDPAFLPLSLSAPNGSFGPVVVLPDGKLLVAASAPLPNGQLLTRLNPDGSTDAGFQPGFPPDFGIPLLVQPGGKIVTVYAGTLRRMNVDGSFDPTFQADAGLKYDYHALAVRPDGRIIVGSLVPITDFYPDLSLTSLANSLAQLDVDGALDPTFRVRTAPGLDPFRGFYPPVSLVVVQPDGKLIVGDDPFYYTPNATLVRLQADGAYSDLSFSSAVVIYPNSPPNFGGGYTPGGSIDGVAPLPDGRLFAGGSRSVLTTYLVPGSPYPRTKIDDFHFLVRLHADPAPRRTDLSAAFVGQAVANPDPAALTPKYKLRAGVRLSDQGNKSARAVRVAAYLSDRRDYYAPRRRFVAADDPSLVPLTIIASLAVDGSPANLKLRYDGPASSPAPFRITKLTGGTAKLPPLRLNWTPDQDTVFRGKTLLVVIDPDHEFADLDETNNVATFEQLP